MLRRLLISLAASLTLVSALAVPVSAQEEDDGSLLALGDSVAFGYQPFPRLFPNASNFTGYPELVGRELELKVVNASCPGETTSGYLAPAPAPDNGCRPYKSAFPLHVSYSGTQSAFAVGYLRTHKVRLVTINIGANDYFLLQKSCVGKPDFNQCVAQGTPGLLALIASNLDTILRQLRTAGGYQGTIVVLTYYGLNYDAASQAGTRLLNSPLIAAASANHALVASGFDAFKEPSLDAGGSACAAGLVISLGGGLCDVHPTLKGAELLAEAVLQALESEPG